MSVALSNQLPMMRTEQAPLCIVCGSAGAIAYTGMIDGFLNVAGEFTMRRCNNRECETLWLDPRPLAEDMHLAYRSYYTHAQTDDLPGQAARAGGLRRLAKSLNAFLNQQTGLAQGRKDLYQMYLSDVAPGRLLEVGCGSGKRLERIRDLGWTVYGQDVDPAIFEVVNGRGIPVFIGELAQAGYGEGEFDAVIMSHVIEHLHDPKAVLRECYRVLKPKGILVITTPNAHAAGAERFGRDWGGLDAPRHMQIFTRKSLEQIVRGAGFDTCTTWTTAARTETFANLSYRFRRARLGLSHVRSRPRAAYEVLRERIYQMWALRKGLIRPESGEECVLQAIK